MSGSTATWMLFEVREWGTLFIQGLEISATGAGDVDGGEIIR
jgi:hypothetical protein